jgi:hypothetical protein
MISRFVILFHWLQLGEYSDPFDLKVPLPETPEVVDVSAVDLPLADDDYSVPYDLKDGSKGIHLFYSCTISIFILFWWQSAFISLYLFKSGMSMFYSSAPDYTYTLLNVDSLYLIPTITVLIITFNWRIYKSDDVNARNTATDCLPAVFLHVPASPPSPK